jgi:hypothetical protein
MFMKNDATVPLPTFTGNLLVPQPNWGHGVAKKDLRKLQPLCDVIQQLQQEGLTSVHLLQIFFNRRIQSLRQRATKMWLYLGLNCPDCSFSEDLGDAEINN